MEGREKEGEEKQGRCLYCVLGGIKTCLLPSGTWTSAVIEP